MCSAQFSQYLYFHGQNINLKWFFLLFLSNDPTFESTEPKLLLSRKSFYFFLFLFFDNISGECNTFSSNTSKYQISKYLELFYRKMVNLSVLFYQYGNRHMLSVPFHMQSHFPLYFFIVCCVCHATITIIS